MKRGFKLAIWLILAIVLVSAIEVVAVTFLGPFHCRLNLGSHGQWLVEANGGAITVFRIVEVFPNTVRLRSMPSRLSICPCR